MELLSLVRGYKVPLFFCAARGDMLDADDFIYDDEEDAEDGECAAIDMCGSHGGSSGRVNRSASPGKRRLLDAVDSARSAAEMQTALREQNRRRNRNNGTGTAENGQVQQITP